MATIAGLWASGDEQDRWLVERWAIRRGHGPTAILLGTTALICALFAVTMVPFIAERELGVVDQQSDPQPFPGLPPYDPDDLSPGEP